MSLYTDLAADAVAILTEFGRNVTLTRQIAGAYDPTTGAASLTITNQTVKAVGIGRPLKDVNGTLILEGDIRLLIAPNASPAPAVNDTVTVGSKVYTITSVNDANPAGTVVLYDCNIRGAS